MLVQRGATRYTQDLAAGLSQVLHDGSANAVYGHERLVTQQGATRTWYVGDALGSVRATLDGAGAVQGTVGYDPWGTPQGDLLGTFGFTGALQDSASGLVHVRARWYDPGQSTFTSRDPFAGFPATPYSLHPYQYAYSNPVLWTDPSGEIVPRGPGHSLACPPTYLLVDERCIRPTWLRWLPGPDEAPRNTPEEMERQAASQLVPVAGVAGVGGVRGGLGRAPQLGKAGVEACINAIGGLLILAGAQANVDVQTRTRRGSAMIWRAISLAPNRAGFNWSPTSADTDGLSGTRGGSSPYWTNPALWFETSFGRPPDPTNDRIVAATEAALVAAGFSVENTPRFQDPQDQWHVSIGGQTPGIVSDGKGLAWPGSKAERRKIREKMASLFTTQVWP